MTGSAVVPGALNVKAASLTADMIVALATISPQAAQTTLADLAEFFQSTQLGNIVNTNITTVGAGTLTAAALKGGLVTRSGSTAAYTDTTATAAQILAALGTDAPPVGTSWIVYIKNTVAFAQTLAGGSGVTLSGQTIIPPNSVGIFLLTYSAATPAFTMRGISVERLTSAPLLAATALNTVGAGTITGAGIAGGVTSRGGAQSNTAFTDTTDTADNIIAALPNANIGQSFLYFYQNTTDANATIAGGTGVTPSVITVVPGKCTAVYLVTYTAASTITMVGLLVTAPNVVSGTAIANGATPVAVTDSRVTANSVIVLTLKTVGGTAHGAFVSAVTAGTGFSINSLAGDTSTYNYLIIN